MDPAKFIKSTKNKDLLVDSHDYHYRYKDIQKNKENPLPTGSAVPGTKVSVGPRPEPSLLMAR